MASALFSLNTFEQNGDFNTGGGQLGYSFEKSISASAALWTGVFPKANRYIITPTVAGLALTLPTVGTDNLSAVNGHIIYFRNLSSTISFNVVNATATVISTIKPLRNVAITATSTGANGWYVMSEATSSFDGDVPAGTKDTLQSAYNNSAAATPKIQLTNAFGAVDIKDATTSLTNMLTVTNNAGEVTFRAGNNGAASTVALNAGTSTGNYALAIGPQSSATATGAAVFGAGNVAAVNAVANSALLSYTGGIVERFGGVIEGTTLSSANKFENGLQWTAVATSTASTTAPTNSFVLFTMAQNTSYRIVLKANGNPTDGTSPCSYIELFAFARRSSAGGFTPFANTLQLTKYQNPNPANADQGAQLYLTASAAGVITAFISAPNNLAAAGTYVYNVRLTYEALTV